VPMAIALHRIASFQSHYTHNQLDQLNLRLRKAHA
jgi:hypothetical protein